MTVQQQPAVQSAKPSKTVYRRLVLKISGEGLGPPGGLGIDGDAINGIAGEIASVMEVGSQVAVVVGGGNFLRGATLASKTNLHEATAHYMGMLATVINALALQDVLEGMGLQTRVQSSIAIHSACEDFIRRRCIAHLEKGRVVILAAGTGRPFVTTDTAAALASVEIGADILFKATKVNGVYTSDPNKDKNAEFVPHLTYNDVIQNRLAVMDVSAVDLCQQTQCPDQCVQFDDSWKHAQGCSGPAHRDDHRWRRFRLISGNRGMSQEPHHSDVSKRRLLGMTPDRLAEIFNEWGEKPFRVKQIFEWIYRHGATTFDQMNNLSKPLREKLAQHFDL